MNADNLKTLPTSFENINSSLEYIYNSFITLSSLNVFLAITATLGNTLIFLALGKNCGLHAPSRLLIRSLAFTDLFVGLISQPLAALHAISILTKHLAIFRFTLLSSYSTSAILSGVSLFTLTFLSIDRLLALSLGVRYRETVTIGLVRASVIFGWVLNITNGLLSFLPENRFVFNIVCVASISLCVVISSICYIKIYYILHQQQSKVHASSSHAQPNESSPLHFERYKKTVSSALWVYFTLLACYLPFGVVSGLKAITGDTLPVAEGFTATLIFFNSSVNPVLYCWRIREVRKAVKETIRQYCGFSSGARSDRVVKVKKRKVNLDSLVTDVARQYAGDRNVDTPSSWTKGD